MASARSASLWAVAGSAGTRGLSFVFFLLIARQLSPADLGVMALALAVGLFLDAVAELGLSDQVVRHPDLQDGALLSGAFWAQTAVAAVGAVLIALLAPLLSSAYREPALVHALDGVVAASVLTAVGLVPTALLARRLQHKAIAVRNTLATAIGGCVGWALACTGHGVLALVAMQLVNAATGTAVVLWASRWRPRWPTQPRALAQALQPVLPLARHTLGTRIIETVMGRADQLLIGSFFGTAALGLYALAVRLYDVLFSALCNPIGSVMLPYLARAGANMADFRQRFLLVLKTTSLVAPPVFIGGALFLPPMMPRLFGPEWEPAAPYIQIILGMGAIQAMSFTHTPAFSALGRPVVNLWVAIVSSVLWLGSLFFLPALGAVYAAVLWAGRSGVGVLMQVLLLRRLTGVSWSDYGRATGGAWLGAAIAALLAIGTDGGRRMGLETFAGAVLCAALSAMVFASVAWLQSAQIRGIVLGVLRPGTPRPGDAN